MTEHLQHSQVSSDPFLKSFDQFIRQESQKCFFRLSAGQINEQEMKVQLSKAIISHIIGSISTQKCTPSYLKLCESLLSDNIIFLKTLYPHPKPSLVNKIIFQKIQDMDEIDQVECDLLANLGINFDRRSERESILNQIQNFFNQMVKSSQDTLPAFTSLLMKQIPSKLPSKVSSEYEKIMKQSWMFQINAEITETSQYERELCTQKLRLKSPALFQIVNKWVANLSEILVDPQSYLMHRKYLKLQKGNSTVVRNSKISQKVKKSNQPRIFKSPQPKRSVFQEQTQNQEIQDPSFFSSLFDKLKNICKSKTDNEGFDTVDSFYLNDMKSLDESKILVGRSVASQKYQSYQFKNGGYLINNFLESLEELANNVNFGEFTEDQERHLRECCMQTIKSVSKNNQNHRFTPQEKLIYSFCQNSYSFTEQLILDRLVKLIQSFCSLKQRSSNNFNKSMVFQGVDLIDFHISNLINAKIYANEEMILAVHSALQQLSKKREVRICKIENKLMDAERAVHIIIKIKSNPVLCCLVLALENNSSVGSQVRISALNSMHKFFTDASKYNFGPLSFFASNITSNDPKTLYMTQIKSTASTRNSNCDYLLNANCYCGKSFASSDNSYFYMFQEQIKEIISDDGRINLEIYRKLIPHTFVCGVCENVIKRGQTMIPVVSCHECGFKVCADCSYKINPETQKKLFVSLIDSVSQISDPYYFSKLEIRDPVKMNYNHQYHKNSSILVGNSLQEKKQTFMHIILQGRGFIRCLKTDSKQSFLHKIRQNINLKNFPEYKQIINKENNVGILFRPGQLMKSKGRPFIFLKYSDENFQKFCIRSGFQQAITTPLQDSEIDVQQNDVFIPILWLFEESIVEEYITKVLRTNPFCSLRHGYKQSPINHLHLSKRRISSNYFI